MNRQPELRHGRRRLRPVLGLERVELGLRRPWRQIIYIVLFQLTAKLRKHTRPRVFAFAAFAPRRSRSMAFIEDLVHVAGLPTIVHESQAPGGQQCFTQLVPADQNGLRTELWSPNR